MEYLPSLVVGDTNGGQHRNVGCDRSFEARAQPAAQTFRTAKTIDDKQIDAIRDRLHNRGLHFRQAALIETTTLCARTSILPDIEGLLSSEIDDVDGRRAIAATLAGRHLDKSAEPQSGRRRTRAHVNQQAIDIKATRIVDRSEA